MFKKIILFLLIFLALAFGVKSQIEYPLIFKTGVDPDAGDTLYIQIQVAKDSLFTQLIDTTGWMVCGQGIEYTYNAVFPDIISSQVYFWRGRHKDIKGHITSWSKFFHFTLNINQAPSGCVCVSPADGEMINR
jgi:hypothetical protein